VYDRIGIDSLFLWTSHVYTSQVGEERHSKDGKRGQPTTAPSALFFSCLHLETTRCAADPSLSKMAKPLNVPQDQLLHQRGMRRSIKLMAEHPKTEPTHPLNPGTSISLVILFGTLTLRVPTPGEIQTLGLTFLSFEFIKKSC